VKLRALLLTALLLGCTSTEDIPSLASEDLDPAVEIEFAIIPSSVDDPPPTLEHPPAPLPTPARWEMWRVLEDADVWLRSEVDLTACDVDLAELPTFPTVAADGSVLALALVSSPVADQRLLTVRLLRTQDAKQMRAYTLIGPDESELPSDELQRRVCHRAKALARALASGGHTSVPVVGGWENRISDGLPERVDGWPRVIGDGATREVDAAVADIVLAPSDLTAPELQLRVAGSQSCSGSSDEFSKVWEAAGIRIFTRGPCGC
jgi:hypothetical protein